MIDVSRYLLKILAKTLVFKAEVGKLFFQYRQGFFVPLLRQLEVSLLADEHVNDSERKEDDANRLELVVLYEPSEVFFLSDFSRSYHAF